MCIPVFIAASTIHNNQALEAAKMPHKWLRKCDVYTEWCFI
jgi:hypothetical protein